MVMLNAVYYKCSRKHVFNNTDHEKLMKHEVRFFCNAIIVFTDTFESGETS